MLQITLPFDAVLFREKLLIASRQGFETLKQVHANESVYCYAYCTNGSLGYVIPILGTEEALTRRAIKYLDDEKRECSNLAQARAEIRHNPGDLAAQTSVDLENDLFREICEMTHQRSTALFEAWSLIGEKHGEDAANTATEPYYFQFIDLCYSVLKQLDREGVFGTGIQREKVIVNFLFDDQDIESMIKSAQELNPASVVEKYKAELYQQYPDSWHPLNA